jgi:hypothetical protein
VATLDMTLNEAKDKVLTTINSDRGVNRQYVIDDKNIVDQDFAWQIPFIEKNINNDLNVFGGALNCYFVDKLTGEIFRPGSGFSIDKWLYAFKIGLRYEKYDLTISKINDRIKTATLLKELDLQWFKEENDNGTVWRIPKSFTEKMINERLQKNPIVFYNQRLNLSFDTFKKIDDANVFYYLLEPSKTTDSYIGERLQ